MHIGFIGLGRMGANMVRRLVRDGHEIVAYNRTVEKTKELEGEGADRPSYAIEELVGEAREAARRLDHGPGGRRHRGPDRRAARAPRARRHDHRRRQHELPRRRRAATPSSRRTASSTSMPGRPAGSGASQNGYCLMVGGDREAVEPLSPDLPIARPGGRLPPRRRPGRRALREDGPQRHRVRPDAGLRRGLRDHARERVPARSRGHLRAVDPRLGRPVVAAGACGARVQGQWPGSRAPQGLGRRLGRGPLDGPGGDRPRRPRAGHHARRSRRGSGRARTTRTARRSSPRCATSSAVTRSRRDRRANDMADTATRRRSRPEQLRRASRHDPSPKGKPKTRPDRCATLRMAARDTPARPPTRAARELAARGAPARTRARSARHGPVRSDRRPVPPQGVPGARPAVADEPAARRLGARRASGAGRTTTSRSARRFAHRSRSTAGHPARRGGVDGLPAERVAYQRRDFAERRWFDRLADAPGHARRGATGRAATCSSTSRRSRRSSPRSSAQLGRVRARPRAGTTAAGAGSSSRSRSGTTSTRRKQLNREVHKVFRESQVYRIDHYLGKETVRNLLVFRFGNGIFEPIWNRRYVDHVQITVAESIGVEDRGAFYEETGASATCSRTTCSSC